MLRRPGWGLPRVNPEDLLEFEALLFSDVFSEVNSVSVTRSFGNDHSVNIQPMKAVILLPMQYDTVSK